MKFTDRLPDAVRFMGSRETESKPFLERAAHWAGQLTYREIPGPVRESAKTQLASTVAAALWTRTHPLGGGIRAAVKAGEDGSSTCLCGGRTAPERAAYGNAALASALEFDGTVLGGPTGRSSVFVPLAYAEAIDASGRRLLVAQVAANEIASRLGAATATGPIDEAHAAHLHAVGAAVGRGVVEDAGASVLADALGTALSQPPRPIERSIFGSEAGVWSASEAIRSGVAAIDSARNGIAGRRDLIEGQNGFLSAVVSHPSPAYLSGLGDRWHTRTLSVKQFPGSVFVAAPTEAALEARGRFDRGRTAVSRIDVYVPHAAIATAARTEAFANGTDRQRSAGPRSMSHAVAAALVDGEPRPAEPTTRTVDVESIAERVSVHHDRGLSVEAARSAGQSGVTLGGVGRLAPLRAARTLGPRAALRHLPAVLLSGRARSPPGTLTKAERRFGARVVVTTADGRTVEATIERPSGFAGAPATERQAIARGKCRDGLCALGADRPTARNHTETLFSIDGSTVVSVASILDVIDEGEAPSSGRS